MLFFQDKSQDLPMLAVYECIDLGLISMLKQTSSDASIVDLLQANHPVLLMDPIHDDTVYVYHAFGVHVLDFGDLLQCLSNGLRADDDESVALNQALHKSEGTHVTPLLNTYSVDRRSVNGSSLRSQLITLLLSIGARILLLLYLYRTTSISLTVYSFSPPSSVSCPSLSTFALSFLSLRQLLIYPTKTK